jgi:hypothetical protein
MSDNERLVFEVECAALDDDERVMWLRVLSPSADELADAIRDIGADFCPVSMEVPDHDIDYRLPDDRASLWSVLNNFRNGFN